MKKIVVLLAAATIASAQTPYPVTAGKAYKFEAVAPGSRVALNLPDVNELVPEDPDRVRPLDVHPPAERDAGDAAEQERTKPPREAVSHDGAVDSTRIRAHA